MVLHGQLRAALAPGSGTSMKESACRTSTITSTTAKQQGGIMTSSSSASHQQRVLKRSQSLASPLNDVTLIQSSGSNGTWVLGPEPVGAAAAAVVGRKGTRGTGLAEEGLEKDGRGAQGGGKKSLRRQRSLAELFGVVLYKSKVQLQELFSRRDKDTNTKRRDHSPSALQARRVGVGVTTDGGHSDVEGGGSSVQSSASSRASSTVDGLAPPSPGQRSGTTVPPVRQQLVPRGPVVKRGSHPDLSHHEGEQRRSRTPEELFCVESSPSSHHTYLHHHHHNDVDRPASSRSLDTLRGDLARGSSPQNLTPPPASSSPSIKDRLLRPDQYFRVKSTLVKSNSDSLCRLSPHPPGGVSGDSSLSTITKASSDDIFFVRRTPSPQLQHQLLLRPDPSDILPAHANNNDDDDGDGGHSSTSKAGGRQDIAHIVVEGLLVGGVEAAYNEPLLCSLGVGAVVDLTNLDPHLVPPEKKITCPCSCGKSHFRAKLHVALDDIEWEDIQQCFPEANAFIHGWRSRGRRVLVVSYHGKSRAPAVVAQYLMTHFRIPLQRALDHVRARRPQTRINPGFMRALQRLDKRLAEEVSSFPSSVSSSPLPAELDSDATTRSPKTAWDEC